MNGSATATAAQGLDAAELKKRLGRNERRKRGIAILLVAPAFLYLVFNFVAPVAIILFKSVDDRAVSSVLERTTRAIAGWDGTGLPGEDAFAALLADIHEGHAAKTLYAAAQRLNSAKAGFHPLIMKTARKLRGKDPDIPKTALIAIDKRWGETVYWINIKRTSKPLTPVYLLEAVDLTIDERGDIAQVPEGLRVFKTLWLRTIWMSFVITLVCIVLGYLVAFQLAHASAGVRNVLMILVLFPFWTAFLVRTFAWIVLLQNEGLVNDLGLFLNLWDERVQLIRNRFGVYVAMSHILLPFMVLPLFAIMRRIPLDYMRAAKSLGADPVTAFVRVYLPLTWHGVGAGALFVFILAVGFYITPALVGGRSEQMIAYFIAFFTTTTLDWGAAAALSAFLLLLTGLLYFLINIVFGLNRMKIG